jgi:riboflavin biosynthesis pyrimidine reductase
MGDRMKLTNLMLMSLDGEIATHPHESSQERIQAGFSSREDQELLRHEVSQSEAVIIGAQSVRVEGGILDLKNQKGVYPTWCIFTNKGLNPTLRFWKQDYIPRILISEKTIESSDESVESLHYGEAQAGAFLMRILKKRGFERVLLLGGGELNRIFYREGLVDELKLTVAPQVIGKGAARFVETPLERSVQLELLSCEKKVSHLFLHYKVCPQR